MSKYMQKIDSPIGKLCLVADNKNLYCVVFEKNWREYKDRFGELENKLTPVLKKTKVQLKEYFKGKRKRFDLPYVLTGTPFQKKVWTSLKKIPFGKTYSYKEQAQLINSPKAVRAVGTANGMNPLSIILPCHRVIGSNGSLTGYGGGLDKKEYLLDLEQTS